jgi:CDP-diacylglycerol--glycerol-3-phosphate 3-phosphatidyltransferase
MNIPNWLTFFRILLIPFLVIIFYLPFKSNNIVCAIIFTVAAITDWLDGYLARTLAQTSSLGAFLDPVADKLIVAVALVLLVGEKGLPFLAIPAAVIIGREIAISALREWMAEIGKRARVAVSHIGKIKTTLQMIAVIVLLTYKPGSTGLTGLWLGVLGYILLYVAAILTLWSMFIYLKTAWSELTYTPN